MKEVRGSVPAAQALTFTASLEVNDGVGCVVSGNSAWNFKDFAEHPVGKVVHPLQPSNRPPCHKRGQGYPRVMFVLVRDQSRVSQGVSHLSQFPSRVSKTC